MSIRERSAMSVDEAIRRRRSVRGFRTDEVPEALLREVFELAQWAPSNCNVQPWTPHVVSGEVLRRLRDALHDDRLLTELRSALAQFGAAPIMFLMLGLSVASIAVILERAFTFARRSEDPAALRRDLRAYLIEGDLAGALARMD